MCASNRHEGIDQRIGHPVVYRDEEGVEGKALFLSHVRQETMDSVLNRPGVSWRHVDLPSDSFTEREAVTRNGLPRREVRFPVPPGKVLGGVLVTTPGRPPFIDIITRPITEAEQAYARTQGVDRPNDRMPVIRDPLKVWEE